MFFKGRQYRVGIGAWRVILWKERTSEARILYRHMGNHAWYRRGDGGRRFVGVLLASGRRDRCLLQYKTPFSFLPFSFFFFLLPIPPFSLSLPQSQTGCFIFIVTCYLSVTSKSYHACSRRVWRGSAWATGRPSLPPWYHRQPQRSRCWCICWLAADDYLWFQVQCKTLYHRVNFSCGLSSEEGFPHWICHRDHVTPPVNSTLQS